MSYATLRSLSKKCIEREKETRLTRIYPSRQQPVSSEAKKLVARPYRSRLANPSGEARRLARNVLVAIQMLV